MLGPRSSLFSPGAGARRPGPLWSQPRAVEPAEPRGGGEVAVGTGGLWGPSHLASWAGSPMSLGLRCYFFFIYFVASVYLAQV